MVGYGFDLKRIYFPALQSLMKPLSSLDITFVPITSPPVLSSTFQDSVKPKSLGNNPFPISTALTSIELLICEKQFI